MKREFYGPVARMALNSIGSALVALGVIGAGDAARLAANADALMVATGLIGLGAQYAGWWIAKRYGWRT